MATKATGNLGGKLFDVGGWWSWWWWWCGSDGRWTGDDVVFIWLRDLVIILYGTVFSWKCLFGISFGDTHTHTPTHRHPMRIHPQESTIGQWQVVCFDILIPDYGQSLRMVSKD